jgi:hypothetical protein
MNCERDIDEWYRVSQDEKMHMWIGNTIPETKEEIENLLIELYPNIF